MFVAPNNIVVKDQLGNHITLPKPATKIVCLVPSLSETLYQMGLQSCLVGITKFCVHPKNLKHDIPIIGGTKTPKINEINNLKPDLIIASKEENIKDHIEALQIDTPVYVSDIIDAKTALQAIIDIAKLTQIEMDKQTWFADFKLYVEAKPFALNLQCAYLIWRKPYMAAGGDTFINFMLERAGFTNVLKNTNRYPEVSADFFAENHIDVILLSSEPYPFADKHIAELQVLAPNAKIILVDGEIFSWYGYRSTKALTYFAQLHKMLV